MYGCAGEAEFCLVRADFRVVGSKRADSGRSNGFYENGSFPRMPHFLRRASERVRFFVIFGRRDLFGR